MHAYKLVTPGLATFGDLSYMDKVADNLSIQVLFFTAEREELHATYSRYVKRLTKERGLTYINDGAAYAIRTQHYPR